MEFVIVFVLMAVVLVAPVMIGARLVGARNTGFGFALLAVIIMTVIAATIDWYVADQLIAAIAKIATGAMVLAGVLGTTFLRGLAVSVIAVIIQIVVVLSVAAMLA